MLMLSNGWEHFSNPTTGLWSLWWLTSISIDPSMLTVIRRMSSPSNNIYTKVSSGIFAPRPTLTIYSDCQRKREWDYKSISRTKYQSNWSSAAVRSCLFAHSTSENENWYIGQQRSSNTHTTATFRGGRGRGRRGWPVFWSKCCRNSRRWEGRAFLEVSQKRCAL